MAFVLRYISFIHISWDDDLNVFKWMYDCTYWQILHCEKADVEIYCVTKKSKVSMMPQRITSLLSQFLFQFFLSRCLSWHWNLRIQGMGWSLDTYKTLWIYIFVFFCCASCKSHKEKVGNCVTYYFIRLLCNMTTNLYVDTFFWHLDLSCFL